MPAKSAHPYSCGEALTEQCILTLSFIKVQTSLAELLMILGVVSTAMHV